MDSELNRLDMHYGIRQMDVQATLKPFLEGLLSKQIDVQATPYLSNHFWKVF